MAGEVIVGYDGSACAKGALSQAVEQARAFGAGLVIAFAYEPPIRSIVLGSTAYKLVHRSPVPVLVVRVPDA
jgi:nucleotide-binding universal stress UspA family protein